MVRNNDGWKGERGKPMSFRGSDSDRGNLPVQPFCQVVPAFFCFRVVMFPQEIATACGLAMTPFFGTWYTEPTFVCHSEERSDVGISWYSVYFRTFSQEIATA